MIIIIRKIILDTNFLMIVGQFNVDIFSELDRICLFNYKLYVLDKTIDELEDIMERQKGKHRQAAKIALILVKQKHLNIIKTKEGKVDNLILKLTNKDYILATLDVLLRKKAIKKGAKAIFLRSKKYLILE